MTNCNMNNLGFTRFQADTFVHDCGATAQFHRAATTYILLTVRVYTANCKHTKGKLNFRCLLY